MQRLPDILRALAARPNGFASKEVPGEWSPSYLTSSIASMCGRKRLFRAKLGHKSVRYFATQEAADRWLADALSPIRAAVKTQRGPAWDVNTPAYEPPGVRKTVRNMPPQRFQTVELPTQRAPSTARAGSQDFRQWQAPGRY